MSAASSSNAVDLIAVQLAQLLGPEICTAGEFQQLHILGQGAHGTTRVVRRKRDGHMLCRKFISFDRLPSSARPAEVLREVEILMLLNGHPHVIGFVGAYVGDGGLNIVQEFAEGGTLQQRLDRRRERDEPLSEPEVLDTFVQITAGLAHLHSHGVLHRDLKPANVFFDRRNLCRLGDFGIASFSSDIRPSKFLGTPLYLSPELIEGRPCDHKADVWALGVLLYEMVSSRPSRPNLFLRVVTHVPEHTSPCLPLRGANLCPPPLLPIIPSSRCSCHLPSLPAGRTSSSLCGGELGGARHQD